MNRQVLVVDDEVEITEGLVALFETEEIAARGASDRESAEALIASEFFPVVLADLRLRTDEEGLRLLEAIRSRSPKSRIATMTGYATPELEAELHQRGATVVLHKPIGFDEILAVVTELLDEIEKEAEAQQERTGAALDLGQLYADVQKILYTIPQKRYGFSAQETEELVQEAWCLFLEKRESVHLPRPWLAGTIANLCKQQIHHRTRSRELNQEISPEIQEAAGSNGATDAIMMVRQALGRIDQRSQKLCVLIGMEGWSYEEVSRELGLPIGSVGPLYIRAKAKLRKALDVVN